MSVIERAKRYRIELPDATNEGPQLTQPASPRTGMTTAAPRSKLQLREAIRQRERELRELGVQRLSLFGSWARGNQNAQSDVDFVVEFSAGMKTFPNFMRTSMLLEETLGRRVELVTPSSLSPYLKPQIMTEMEDVLPAPAP